MKSEEIVSVLQELYNISGFRISLHGMNFEEIAAYPKNPLPICARIHGTKGELAKCKSEDAELCKQVRNSQKTIIRKCRYGLTEVICPLHSLGSPSGYLMMGQLKDETVDDRSIADRLCAIGISEAEATELVSSIQVVSIEKTASLAKIMTICAEYLTLINALQGSKPSTAELTRLYIYENFREKINMKDICAALGRTKSALCPTFREKYGITVMDYLTELRIEEAKRMLHETDMTIAEIAEGVGFSDTSYFSKVFQKNCSLSPSQFRKRETK
ncbi:MAG: PocR ligand-binding domain-containing protein [Clostridia bacterium]|nr:PocR ligand-binding domain-containing protein [Clostridia bacterium]